MSWLWTVLMPHPPIIVPEVGRGAEADAALTIKGVSAIMDKIRGCLPDRLLLMSPHHAYVHGAFAMNRSEVIKGNLGAFSVPEVAFTLSTPLDNLLDLFNFMKKKDIPVEFTESPNLSRDQGSMVPLYFLRKCFGKLPPVILTNVSGLGLELSFKMGRALAEFDDGHKWGLIASGDLSHRLKPGAPAGYSPQGMVFDKAITDALASTDINILRALSAKTLRDAGECGLCPVSAMIGFNSATGWKIETLSYEGPFGVGYCCAISKEE